MTQTEVMHEIQRALGRIEAKQQATEQRLDAGFAGADQRRVENHAEARQHWDALYAELRTIKHDQRNIEAVNGGTVRGLRNLAEKTAANGTQIGAISKRLSAIETLGYKITAYATIGATLAATVMQVVIHYGGWILKTVGLKA